ncbi:response regulator transcription factor [Ensifer adhaerens]|uniref:Response regulator n=1 Tax=Ensifer adhaerens TaxID=106592 RepID=A0A9Q8YFX6_ENSAD|nr:response regulator [Ensifer adhaerens]USJ27395.1 response regulator [Ensifer adhaerens]UTV41017.1 response regulator [Ensifer adhaerens]
MQDGAGQEKAGTVFIVDDDERVVHSLQRLLKLSGYAVTPFADARSLLGCAELPAAECVVLDLGLPDTDGLCVQETLLAMDTGPSIVFLTGRADVPSSVRAMKAGAVDFLLKPVEEKALLMAIEAGVQRTRGEREADRQKASVQTRLQSLTVREEEVLQHVVAGRLNKQIAGDLGTVEKTIKVHRARMMAKMGVRTVADLVRLVEYGR